MSTAAQMTLSKELISVITCIDEGNETQPRAFQGILSNPSKICSELTNLFSLLCVTTGTRREGPSVISGSKSYLQRGPALTSEHETGEQRRRVWGGSWSTSLLPPSRRSYRSACPVRCPTRTLHGQTEIKQTVKGTCKVTAYQTAYEERSILKKF